MKVIKIGIVTDIHSGIGEPYLDRYTESSPQKLESVVEHFNKMGLDFIVNLGDTIDHGFSDIDPIQRILKKLKAPVYQITGNHDYDVGEHEKASVLSALQMKAPYYEVIMERYQFLFLNGNEISTYAHVDLSDDYKRSKQELIRLQKKGLVNANDWNGGIGQKQLNWINQKLKEAQHLGQKSVMFCHFPILPPDKHNLLNDREVLKIISRHPNAKAWICGHNHDGNYGKINNCHVVNLKALVNTPDQNAYSVLEVHRSKVVIKGFGREIDRELDI